MNEAPLARIGRYAVLAELGRGAMGVVYKARDPQLDRLVAIKTLRRDLGLPAEEDADLRRRVYLEATAAGRLAHPNIIAIHDVIELDGIPYIVMEYVEGRTLADLIAADGPLPAPRAVRLAIDVCDGLEYAHGRGVIHRDIKPSNILVTAGGTAKLGDFGIARVAGSRLTRTGAFLGTPAYMAPEQLRGRALDGRSDIFALGVTLYEALAGVPPFEGEDLAAILYQVAHGTPVPLRQRNPAVPLALESVTERALAKDPEARPATARVFGDALARAMSAPAGPGPNAKARSRGAAAGPPSRRPRARAALVAVACLAVAGIGGGVVWARWAPDRPITVARPSAPAEPRPGPAPEAPAPSSPSPARPSPREVVPAPPVVASRPGESDRSGSPALAPAPSAETPAVAPAPAEEPVPPTTAGPPAEGSPRPVVAAPPAGTERSPGRPAPAPGSISVATDPSVEVFVDGEFRGRTEGEPLVVPGVAPGQRRVTLRRGARELTLVATVSGGRTTPVSYRFPAGPVTAENLRETLEKRGREAGDKVREGVGRARREALGALRDILDKADGNRDGRGRRPEQQ